MTDALTATEFRGRLVAVCEAVIDNRDALTAADCDLGDGDHGTTMAKAFGAAREKLEVAEAPSIPGDLRLVGMQMLAAGGTMGALFGTLFKRLGDELHEDHVEAVSLADALASAASAVEARGRAKRGDKTMLDALVPATEAMHAHAGEHLSAALAAAASAARAGAAATRDMVPRAGKARTMGPRGVGYVDPGALTVAVVFEALAQDRSPSHDISP